MLKEIPLKSKIEINAYYGCEFSEKYHVLVEQNGSQINLKVQLGDDKDLFTIPADEFERLWKLLIRKQTSPDIDLFEPEMGSTADHGGEIKMGYQTATEKKVISFNVGVLEDFVNYFDKLIRVYSK